jgi:hypothetical protein
MTDEEKDGATINRVRNPPVCKCGYCDELVNPPARLDYTPIPLSVILEFDVIYFVVIKILCVCKRY